MASRSNVLPLTETPPLESGLAALAERLRLTDPQKIVLAADCDMTLAIKPAENFHFLSLLPDQHRILRQTVEALALCMVITARGEKSTLDILHGQNQPPIDQLVIASNCGHCVLDNAAEYTKDDRIHHPIGSMSQEEALMLRDAIHKLIASIAKTYEITSGSLILDPREFCGAIIWQDMTLEAATRLTRLAQKEKGALPAAVTPLLHYDSKYIEIGGKNFGYMDFKPHGMDKGSSFHAMLNMPTISQRIPSDPLVIVAGDSMPDYAMMEAAVEHFGPENVVAIQVGDDPMLSSVQDIDIVRIRGDQHHAIPQFYQLLEAAATCPKFTM